MSAIADRLASVRARIEQACAAAGRDACSVQLLAVSKRHPPSAVREALAAGQSLFGENRVQEFAPKAAELAGSGARWHFIGSVQTNKAAALCAVPSLEVLHSVDRPKLVERLAVACGELRRSLRVLIQVNATGEDQKHGVLPADALALAREVVAAGPALALDGVMAMGPLDGAPEPVFADVAALHARLRDALGVPLPTLSLGMSGDLEAAIAAGSTLVRIGTDVFGERVAGA
ncbi:MAG: YggS family pyridoxal phosphate-dependent enzyme [Planctomycetota bacterium]|nr:YggS family pyridoxal phosphate-dependent enzyme [Planctomycetota bacterium]MDA0933559.1 YggS family pyridoxal phosphate-dependent enzyme [Planctomycetota bacterium]MDA1220752.1 YggS family pyridoxal phosphate-dependent enzyme [Planctomycetota bacterium]